MGMRCSQPQGLPDTAVEFLRRNAVKSNECPHCHRFDEYEREVIGSYGMFDEMSLYRYTLNNGKTADEFVQREIWDCGPVTWLGLRSQDRIFVWLSQTLPK